jgi:acyl CoA:acetate/3-ketoacid CoA transferase alpha subunit
VVSNDIGTCAGGLGPLLSNGQISKAIVSYIGDNREAGSRFSEGLLELELCPQGTLAERLRAGGAGIPAFYTATGVGTILEIGGFPTKFSHIHHAYQKEKSSEPRESRIIHGKKYLLERSLQGDFALIKAWKADTEGNLVFRYSARNFNPECAKAAKVCIVEVEEIVPAGDISPEDVHLPGIYVDRVVIGENPEKKIAKKTLREDGEWLL